MITVGKAASMFGLSRTALLYYDSIGLLSAKRAENGYRLYSEEDIERLKQIITLRNAGVPLGEISDSLASPGTDVSSVLLKRLGDINREIEKNRRQQYVLIKLLKDADLKQTRAFRPEEWIEILRRAGVESGTELEWHVRFETQSPGQHQNLLRALGFSREEIERFKNTYESRRGKAGMPGEDKTV